MYRLKKAESFIEFKNGKSIKPEKDGVYPIYGANGVIGMSSKYREENSVVIGRVGAYCGSVQFCKGKYWASDNTIVAYPKNSDTYIVFLYYLLKNSNLSRWAGGSAQPLITQTLIRQIELHYTNINNQHKIASILSAYDDLIENNTKRIKILEQMADAIYKEWFIKFRFPGYEKVKFVNSELGKIPEGWEVKTFLEVSHLRLINENILPYQGTKKYFATADVEGIDFVKDGIEYSYHNKPSRAQKQPVLNSVWFARMKDTYKVLLFSSPNLDLVDSIMLSSGFVGFEALSEKWLSFLFISIKSQEFHKQKDIFCTGATQMSLTNEGLARIKWLFPKENIIEEYDKLVRPIINSILVYQKQNKILRQTRDILLPKLISGELDVSNLEMKVKK